MKKKNTKMMLQKRIAALLAIFALVFSDMHGVVYAAEDSWEEVQLDDISGIENTTELNNLLAERGSAIRKKRLDDRGFALTNIKRLLQNDSQWKDVVIGTRENGTKITMGESGCTITSFTIVSNWLSNTSITPVDVKNRMGSNACPFAWTVAESLYGYDLAIKEMNDNGIASGTDTILGAIDLYETPVIVGVKNAATTHFVVAYGYTSSYDIIISDPAQRNYTTLSQYLNEGYYIHRIFLYLK